MLLATKLADSLYMDMNYYIATQIMLEQAQGFSRGTEGGLHST